MKEVINNVLVLKVGTNTLIEKHEDGSENLDLSSFERIGKQILKLRENDVHAILVSSGAITAGMMAVGMATRPRKETEMTELQRLASIGWRHILNAWDEVLGDTNSGGVLLTRHDLALSSEREELLRVTHTMLSHGDVVVANENDVVAHDEIKFGDNDTLAATFAAKLGQSALFGSNVGLVILSDVDGLYADKDDASTLIRGVNNLSDYEYLAGGAESANGTGGMLTKFEAARIAQEAGITMWIANGRADNAIQRALDGEVGTRFVG